MIQNSLSPVVKSRISSSSGRTIRVENRSLARTGTMSSLEYLTTRAASASARAGKGCRTPSPRTNTASGHVYSFLLTEITSDPSAEPDLKIFVELKESSGVAGASGLGGYVRTGEAEAYKRELESVRTQAADEVRAAQARVADDVGRFRSSYATKLQFDYSLDTKAAREPFLVSAIYHDDTFTYIRSAAREKPALYELKDGKPNLISFQLENGVYIAPKIIDSGYLSIGNKKLSFARRAAN